MINRAPGIVQPPSEVDELQLEAVDRMACLFRSTHAIRFAAFFRRSSAWPTIGRGSDPFLRTDPEF